MDQKFPARPHRQISQLMTILLIQLREDNMMSMNTLLAIVYHGSRDSRTGFYTSLKIDQIQLFIYMFVCLFEALWLYDAGDDFCSGSLSPRTVWQGELP